MSETRILLVEHNEAIREAAYSSISEKELPEDAA